MIMSVKQSIVFVYSYNHHREDEEIYKEFLDIANDRIPLLMRRAAEKDSYRLTADAQCYGFLLHFYDGICGWEEGSATPVLHVGWAKHLCNSLAKFEAAAREMVQVQAQGESEEEQSDSQANSDNGEVHEQLGHNNNAKAPVPAGWQRANGKHVSSGGYVAGGQGEGKENMAWQAAGSQDDHMKTTIQELESKVAAEAVDDAPNPNIDALAKACGEAILNPEYLLSGGEPFTSTTTTATATSTTDTRVDVKEFLSSRSHSSPFPGMTMDSMLKAESPADMLLWRSQCAPDSGWSTDEEEEEDSPLLLCSVKMKGLKDLLTATKLNSSAIKLQLTAQSQVHFKAKPGSTPQGLPARKRARRE